MRGAELCCSAEQGGKESRDAHLPRTGDHGDITMILEGGDSKKTSGADGGGWRQHPQVSPSILCLSEATGREDSAAHSELIITFFD